MPPLFRIASRPARMEDFATSRDATDERALVAFSFPLRAVLFFPCGITSEGVKVLRNFRKLKKVLNFGVENRQRKRKELDNQYQALDFESALIVGSWTRSGKEKAPTNFLIDAYLESALIVGSWTRSGKEKAPTNFLIDAYLESG